MQKSMGNRVSRPPAILLEWAKGISKNDPKYMTSFYSKKAVLLATYEPMALGRKDIYEYFVEFVDRRNMTCEITTCVNQRDEQGIVVSSGFYIFTFDLYYCSRRFIATKIQVQPYMYHNSNKVNESQSILSINLFIKHS